MKVIICHMLAASLECCQAEIKNMKVVICLQNLLSAARLKEMKVVICLQNLLSAARLQ